ncbi:MAG: hypothetical protein NTW93_06620 [Phycisphaerae bacterium]|nr:hypothetical protein [Phycisphaerae bacterium]
MDISKEQSESVSIWQLTDEQRQQIYEEEKRCIEKTSPMLSKRAIFYVAVYFFGCLLLYFGIPQAFIDFCGTRQWTYQPESNIFVSLLNAAVELIRPFLAVVITFWVVAVPAGIIWGVWILGNNFIKFFKRLVNKGKN